VSVGRRTVTTGRGPQWWRGFVARYGWRAYALPVLVVLTVAALLQGTTGKHAAAHALGATTAGTKAGKTSAKSAGGAKFTEFGNEGGPDQTTDAAPDPVTLRTDIDSDVCAHNEYTELAVVSIAQQHAWMCDKHMQVYSTPVTTGSHVDNDETPLGSWRVQGRQRDRYLVGPGYRDYVHFWVPFNGDFGFHDATWQTMAFGSPNYVTKGSHGCVHMPMPAMTWFYSWAKVNETVVTIEA
jgi:L,D-transpeptidase catalytic domain